MARVQIASGYTPPTTESKRWRMDPEVSGGGLLMDIGSHAIDLLHFWLGDVCDVAAFVDTIAYDVQVENSSSIILRFINGAQASVIVNQNVGFSRNTIELAGTAGRLELMGGLTCQGVELEKAGEKQSFDLPAPKITHLGIVENLVASIKNGRSNCIAGEEGLKTTRVLAAAYKSSKQRSKCVPTDRAQK